MLFLSKIYGLRIQFYGSISDDSIIYTSLKIPKFTEEINVFFWIDKPGSTRTYYILFGSDRIPTIESFDEIFDIKSSNGFLHLYEKLPSAKVTHFIFIDIIMTFSDTVHSNLGWSFD